MPVDLREPEEGEGHVQNIHRQVRIQHEGVSAEVDEGIAPLILELWRHGFETTASCEDFGAATGWQGLAYITFASEGEARRFWRLLPPHPVLELQPPHLITYEGTEHGLRDPWYPEGSCSVYFPSSHIADVLGALTRSGSPTPSAG